MPASVLSKSREMFGRWKRIGEAQLPLILQYRDTASNKFTNKKSANAALIFWIRKLKTAMPCFIIEGENYKLRRRLFRTESMSWILCHTPFTNSVYMRSGLYVNVLKSTFFKVLSPTCNNVARGLPTALLILRRSSFISVNTWSLVE